MERIKPIKKPSLILSSDWHLRKDKPICWIDAEAFQKEQWDTLDFLKNLQVKYNCPIICAGDLFDKWYNSNDFLTTVMQHLPDQIYVVYGQHDLPNHSIDLAYKSSIDTLAEAGKLTVFAFGHYGQEFKGDGTLGASGNIISVWHHLMYITPPFPGATGGNVTAILKKYTKLDLLITGDNHQSFYTEYEGRLLVNPGSLTRQTADQMDFQPRVALWYAETNTIEWVNIPIAKDVITREHIEHKEQRDARIDAFISKLDSDYEIGMSFEQNLKAYFAKNETRDSIKEIIYKSIEWTKTIYLN